MLMVRISSSSSGGGVVLRGPIQDAALLFVIRQLFQRIQVAIWYSRGGWPAGMRFYAARVS